MTATVLNSNNTRILVCCHNPCALPLDGTGILMPIHSATVAPDWDIQRDDRVNGEECDNISGKDSEFCELTKLYWAWKNMKKVCPNIEYIGMNHYRRYFSFDKKQSWIPEIVKRPNEVADYRLNVKRLSKILEHHDIIVSKPFILPCSVWTQYCEWEQSKDIQILSNVVKDMYPDYKEDFDTVMWGNKLIGLNMFIMKWDAFVSYCEWLFNIFFEVERHIDTSTYPPNRVRAIAVLSERLWPVYIRHNFKHPKYLNVLFYNNERRVTSWLYNCCMCTRYQLSWALVKPYIGNWYEARLFGFYAKRFIRRLYTKARQIAGGLLRKAGLKH